MSTIPPEGVTQPAAGTTPLPPRSAARQWGIPLAVIGAVFLVVIVAGLAFSGNAGDSTVSTAPTMTQLDAAHDYCSAGQVADGGHTLIVDTAGDETGSGSATFEDLGCLLGFLDVPTRVTSQIERTRALDGMQDASWDGWSASWTYHPDAGLDITITDN